MSINQNQVSVIIPALNEASAIKSVIHGLLEKLTDIELIVVNDGSTDDTKTIANMEGVRLINHEHTLGYGASLRTGMEASTREYVLFCDGDGQHTVDDVERLINEMDEHDLVIGIRGKDSHTPFSRQPGKRILKWFADYLAGQKIPDLNSGLRIFRKEVLKRYLHLMPDGFSFSTTSTLVMIKTKRIIKYVPIRVYPRVGKSSVRQLRHGMETIMLILRLIVLFNPLKVFLNFAGFVLFLSLASLLIDMLFYKTGLSDTTVTLSISTLIIFLFGLLCDQVSALRRELHEK